jgi:predicted nuclease of predicted toxin-antitoxin system
MNFWINAQLPRSFATWLSETFSVNAASLDDLGLRDAQDIEIFYAARDANAVIITKDRDFIDLVTRLGAPPQILWLTCGNITNRDLHRIFSQAFPEALKLLQAGDRIVEISGM